MVFEKVVIGGTFDRLHVGHKRVLDVGFMLGNSIVIGLTSDEFADRFRTAEVASYNERKKNLVSYLKKFKKPYEIIRIDDSYGVATIDPDVDCIVVSEETLLRAEEINTIRFKKGLSKLAIVVVPLVLGYDGKPISSDRITAGEIDERGDKKKALIHGNPPH